MAEIPGIGKVRPASTSGSKVGEANRKTARMASEDRPVRSGDDRTRLALSKSIRSQISGLKVEVRNIQDMISRSQIEDRALGTVGEMVRQIKNLAVQASRDTLTAANRRLIQQEIEDLRIGVNRVTRDTLFNEQPVAAELGTKALAQIDLSTTTSAQEAVVAADSLLEEISSRRSDLGAEISLLQNRISSLSSQDYHPTPDEPPIRSSNIAEEAVGQTLSQIRGQASTAVTAQANISHQNLHELLE